MLTFFLVQPAGCKAFMATCRPPAGPGLRIDRRRPQGQALQDSPRQMRHELATSWDFIMQFTGHVLRKNGPNTLWNDGFFGNLEFGRIGNLATRTSGAHHHSAALSLPPFQEIFTSPVEKQWLVGLIPFCRTTRYCYIAHNPTKNVTTYHSTVWAVLALLSRTRSNTKGKPVQPCLPLCGPNIGCVHKISLESAQLKIHPET